MENETWYDYFLDVLAEKYPKKSQLTQTLMDLLEIEREAVYRRLRKDVAFSVHEIVKIAATWNLSLDKIASVNTGMISFHMQMMNYINPSEQEIKYLRQIIQSIYALKNDPTSEFMDICNKLPRQLLAGYKYLNQFHTFKWVYQYGRDNEIVPFSKVLFSKEKLKLTADYYQAIKYVPTSNFIFDHKIFEHLLYDIEYFHSIQMVTDEEKELIKKDLTDLVTYLFDVANRGYYPETRNKVNLYISQLNIDTNYSYVYTQDAKICFVHVFDKYEIHSFDTELVTNFKTWMQLKKRTSIQVSEVDERSRIEFFMKQRQLVEKL